MENLGPRSIEIREEAGQGWGEGTLLNHLALLIGWSEIALFCVLVVVCLG